MRHALFSALHPPSCIHTLTCAGGQLGTIIALLTAPLIINSLGWPAVFELYGVSGLIWMVFWTRLVADYAPLMPPPIDVQTSSSSNSSRALTAPGSSTTAGTKDAAAPTSSTYVEAAVLEERRASGADASSSSSSSSGSTEPPPTTLSWASLKALPWRSFFTNKAFLAIVMAHSAFGEWSTVPCLGVTWEGQPDC
jgi:hypothetical protein